jgi:hypothetical protein
MVAKVKTRATASANSLLTGLVIGTDFAFTVLLSTT